MSSITVKQKLGVVALPYTLISMFLLILNGLLVLVLVYFIEIPNHTYVSVYTCFLDAVRLIIPISFDKWCRLSRAALAFIFVPQICEIHHQIGH